MCVNLSERNCAVYLFFFIILIISLTCKILNSLFLPCESFVKETGSINEDEPWFVAGGFEIIFVSVAPKAVKCRPPISFQRKLLRKQFTRGKKEQDN